MPCVCLSRRKKERPRSVPFLQTDFNLQDQQPTLGVPTDPFSPGLKFGRLTLLARIERVFHPSKTEKVELPPPIRPESIVGLSLHPGVSHELELVGNTPNFFQSLPNVSGVLPKHPDSAGLVHQSAQGAHPNMASETPHKSRPRSLIIEPHARNSQYAVVLDTSHHVQPPISPEPTPTMTKPNSPFQPHNNSVSPPQSAALPPTCPISPHINVLRPRFNGLMTPPLTPPPNVPLPPIPAASATSGPDYASPHTRSKLYSSQLLPYRDSNMYSPPSATRKRSQSSPLSSGIVISFAPPPVAASRPSRSFSSPDSCISESETSDDTSPTSEESLPNELPIAPFECSYSPPPPLPVIQDFSKQFLNPTRQTLH